MSRCAIEENSYQPTQQRVRAPTPAGRDKTTQRVGRGSVPGIVEGGYLRSDARAAAPVQQGPVGDAPPAFIGAPPGSAAPVRERDASEGA